MKKRIRIAAVAVLLLLFAGCVAYLWPVGKQLRVTMCTAKGETAEVVIDVRFRRSLIYPTVMEGTITFDGRDYREFGEERGSFLEGIREKAEYGGDPPVEYYGPAESAEEAERIKSLYATPAK